MAKLSYILPKRSILRKQTSILINSEARETTCPDIWCKMTFGIRYVFEIVKYIIQIKTKKSLKHHTQGTFQLKII